MVAVEKILIARQEGPGGIEKFLAGAQKKRGKTLAALATEVESAGQFKGGG